MSYLELVFASFGLRRWVEEINGKNLEDEESAF